MLNANDPKITALLEAWHRNQVEVGTLKGMRPETMAAYQKHAEQRSKFIALDNGSAGHFLVDRTTEQVYSIKGYGQVNLKKPRGTVEFLTNFINKCTAEGKEYTHTFWYALHPVE